MASSVSRTAPKDGEWGASCVLQGTEQSCKAPDALQTSSFLCTFSFNVGGERCLWACEESAHWHRDVATNIIQTASRHIHLHRGPCRHDICTHMCSVSACISKLHLAQRATLQRLSRKEKSLPSSETHHLRHLLVDQTGTRGRMGTPTEGHAARANERYGCSLGHLDTVPKRLFVANQTYSSEAPH